MWTQAKKSYTVFIHWAARIDFRYLMGFSVQQWERVGESERARVALWKYGVRKFHFYLYFLQSRNINTTSK